MTFSSNQKWVSYMYSQRDFIGWLDCGHLLLVTWLITLVFVLRYSNWKYCKVRVTCPSYENQSSMIPPCFPAHAFAWGLDWVSGLSLILAYCFYFRHQNYKYSILTPSSHKIKRDWVVMSVIALNILQADLEVCRCDALRKGKQTSSWLNVFETYP